jgi:hypothetical protein
LEVLQINIARKIYRVGGQVIFKKLQILAIFRSDLLIMQPDFHGEAVTYTLAADFEPVAAQTSFKFYQNRRKDGSKSTKSEFLIIEGNL